MAGGLKELNDIAELLQKTLDPKCGFCAKTIAALKFYAKHPERLTPGDPLRLKFFVGIATPTKRLHVGIDKEPDTKASQDAKNRAASRLRRRRG